MISQKAVRALLPPAGLGRFAPAAAVVSVGSGAYTAGSILFYTRAGDVTPAAVSVALSVAGAVAILGNLGMGQLADRVGPKLPTIATCLLQVALLLAAAIVTEPGILLSAAGAVAVILQANKISRNVWIGSLTSAQHLVRSLAYMRSLLNGGIVIGALGASIAIGYDTIDAYRALILSAAGLNLVGGALFALVPVAGLDGRSSIPMTQGRASERPVLRSGGVGPSYFALGLLTGYAGIGNTVLTVGLPLWIANSTSIPLAWSGLLHALNTGLVLTLQVRASKRAQSVLGATVLFQRGAVVLALACPLFWLSSVVPSPVGVVTLALAVAALTMAELWNSGAAWGLSFHLSPAESRGAYLSTFSIGDMLQEVVGPLAVVLVVISFGSIGWLALALTLCATSLVAKSLTDRAIKEYETRIAES